MTAGQQQIREILESGKCRKSQTRCEAGTESIGSPLDIKYLLPVRKKMAGLPKQITAEVRPVFFKPIPQTFCHKEVNTGDHTFDRG